MPVLEQDRRKAETRGRVTIADVSDALGISKSTVSRALNEYADISTATQNRVRRMAEKMGYRPLSYAQAIKTGQTKSLGLVIQLADHDAQRPFLAEFLSGLSQGASVEGWTLTIAASDGEQATLETFQKLIDDRKVDGFILPRTLIDDARIELLRCADIPFVLFGRTHDPTGCAWFDILGENAMRDAVTRLASLGHRRIGFINGGRRYNYASLRQDGFLRGMEEAGLKPDPTHMKERAVTEAAGEACANEILATDAPPTAIICAVDRAALGVYRAASAFGLQIGRNLSVIGYDGIPEGAHAAPPLATFAVDYTQAGKRLSELLIKRIKGAPAEDLREVTDAIFLEGGSLGPPDLQSER